MATRSRRIGLNMLPLSCLISKLNSIENKEKHRLGAERRTENVKLRGLRMITEFTMQTLSAWLDCAEVFCRNITRIYILHEGW
jgi:hypothetical protein